MRLLAAITLAALAATPTAAQFSVISGVVSDGTGQALPGAAVVLDDETGARRGTTTDTLGAFVFQRVPPGRYVISATHLGYAEESITLELGFDERHVVQLTLEQRTTSLDTLTVEGGRAGTERVSAGRYRIQSSELERIPVPGISPDLMGYLLMVPGTARLGDTGGHLFVRGGTPTQNLVLVDGLPLYQPFHIVGFYSAFPGDIISHADVFAGGFGARYGGRLSSVIDVTTRNGDKQRLSGTLSLAPFLSTALLEIPVQRDRVSLLLSARESVIERVGPILSSGDFPFRFGDYFVKLHAFLNRTSSFSATAIRTYDRGAFDTASGSQRTVSWQNEAYGGRYLYLPADFPVMTQLAVYLSRYESAFIGSFGDRSSVTTGVNADINFTYLLGSRQLDFGIFGRSNSFDYAIGRSRRAGGQEFVTEGGGYVEFSADAARFLHVQAGLRAHAFSNGLGTAVEPRLRLSVEPGGFLRNDVFGLAAGVYHQQIVGLTALEDVTDVFIAWIPSTRQRPVPRAIHLIGSWSRTMGRHTLLRTEGYVRWLSRLAAPRYDRLSDVLLEIDALDGLARGIDVRIEHTGEDLFLALGYALAEVRYEGAVPWPLSAGAFSERVTAFHPPHDRRHQLNVAAEYRAGAYRLAALWQFGSGTPYSEIYGFHPVIMSERPDRAFHTKAGETAAAFGPPFQGRTPPYHRLDLSGERRFRLQAAEVAVRAGVVNVYGRNNLFDYDLLTGERVDQLPLIPYAGVRVALNQ